MSNRGWSFAAALVMLGFAWGTPAAAAPDGGFVEIAPGVHVRHGAIAGTTPENHGAIANLGFIVGTRAVAMIDSGGSVADGEAALAAIRLVTDKPVKWLIDTHMHPDHVFGNQVFAAAGVTILGHRRLPAALAARADFYKQSMREQLGPALDDAVTAVRHVIDNEALTGAVNAVAPNPVTNGEFARALGQALRRPALLPLPAWAARLVMGEMAEELLLASTRVEPRKLLDSDCSFGFPELAGALDHLL